MSSPMHLSVSSSALSALRPSSYAFVLIVIFINSNLTFGHTYIEKMPQRHYWNPSTRQWLKWIFPGERLQLVEGPQKVRRDKSCRTKWRKGRKRSTAQDAHWFM